MENVGESNLRNLEYQNKYTREMLLQGLVKNQRPIIFDIGAHHGESVNFLSKIFKDAIFYSFEPDPTSFEVLSNSVPASTHCFKLAISETDGITYFYKNKISHTNSLLKVNLESKDSIAIARAKSEGNLGLSSFFNQELRVDSLTLDSFIKKHSINYIDLLKIDVQGAECLVLQGAKDALKHVRTLVLEISFFDYYERNTSFMEVESLLPAGFGLYSISEISNNPMNGRTDWVEVIYLNKTLQEVASKQKEE